MAAWNFPFLRSNRMQCLSTPERDPNQELILHITAGGRDEQQNELPLPVIQSDDSEEDEPRPRRRPSRCRQITGRACRYCQVCCCILYLLTTVFSLMSPLAWEHQSQESGGTSAGDKNLSDIIIDYKSDDRNELLARQMVFAQPATDPNEVAALKRMIDLWNLGSKLDISNVDPCIQNATWANQNANPRVACACNGNTCHITNLKICALDISGPIPSDLFVLKELVDLNLGQNVLTGPIPAEIGLLSKMEHLSLGFNNLTGPVPPELGNLTKLLSLSFSSNNFVGSLPTSLERLTSLQQLYIDSSGVSGPIPQELANLISLQTIWVSDNQFTGHIPEFFGNFADLKDLRIQGTSLRGPIPNSFSNLNKLETLRIGDLSGQDSSLEFLQNQKNLSILILRNCLISGQIPERLGTFSMLNLLDLSFNKLTGQVPASFRNLNALQYLFLGSNNLSGDLPSNIVGSQLIALDVSFNPLSGNLPQNFAKVGFSMNVAGTSINANGLLDSQASGLLQCLQADSKCSRIAPSSSFSIKCGGSGLTFSGIEFEDDSETLGAASLYASSDNLWAVSNVGNFISNPNGPQYTAQTESQITGTLDSELYKAARISPSSLRYYGLGLKNGRYNIEVHFSEIEMDDSSSSWKGLGRRIFDIYIQGERVLQDFNIQKEAGGSNRALVRTFQANVTKTTMDIHFFWAGKGTCCIPFQSTYGPLVSAIHVSQVSDGTSSKKRNKKQVGKIAGIAAGCAAGVVILVLYCICFGRRMLQETSRLMLNFSPNDNAYK